MSTDLRKADKKPTKGQTPEEIINGFNALRTEQRNLANKLSEFNLDVNEHRTVIETLKKVDAERKCFRMIGGILTERKVKDVLPILQENFEQLNMFIEKLTQKLEQKGTELNEYREKFNIRVGGSQAAEEIKEEEQSTSETRGNVLVS